MTADRDEGLMDEDLEEEERVYDETFKKLKDIGKELLFSGAERTIKNNKGFTPLELLENYPGMLKPFHMRNMTYVLSPPKGC